MSLANIIIILAVVSVLFSAYYALRSFSASNTFGPQINIDEDLKEKVFLMDVSPRFTGSKSPDEYITSYMNNLVSVISTANTCIKVLDFVDHGKQMESNREYSEILEKFYEQYFNLIENIVLEKKIRYVRILQLPIHKINILDIKDVTFFDDPKMQRQKMIELAIDKLYSPSRKHIHSMIEKGAIELFVLSTPVRSISEAIIDDSIWISEIDKYDLNGRPTPDRMFINTRDESPNMDIAIKIENSIIDDCILGLDPLTAKEVNDAVKKVVISYDKQRDNLTEKIMTLKNDFNLVQN